MSDKARYLNYYTIEEPKEVKSGYVLKINQKKKQLVYLYGIRPDSPWPYKKRHKKAPKTITVKFRI